MKISNDMAARIRYAEQRIRIATEKAMDDIEQHAFRLMRMDALTCRYLGVLGVPVDPQPPNSYMLSLIQQGMRPQAAREVVGWLEEQGYVVDGRISRRNVDPEIRELQLRTLRS